MTCLFSVKAIQEKIDDLLDTCQAMAALAEAEKRDLDSVEQAEFDRLMTEIGEDGDQPAGLYKQLARARKLESAKLKNAARLPVQSGTTRIDPVPDELPSNGGFKHFGEFALAVRRANPQAGNHTIDHRLLKIQNAPTTYGNEGTGADGGFAVPPDFRSQIVEQVMGEDSLLARCDLINTASNSVTIPRDETTPWQSSGGVLAYWDGEADQLTQTKPALKEANVRLNKVTALVPVTDELLEDAPAMASYLTAKAPAKINFKINLAIVQGTGAGQPLGILNSGCTVSVAKESSQVADTIVGLNVLKMWARCYGPSRRNAVWLANQDAEVQLQTLMKIGKLDTGAADTGWGFAMPQFSYGADGSATLMGRPVIFTQACETVGDKGDLILADLSQYMGLLKSGNSGVRQDVSMHLWFDYGVTAFRFVLRVGGQPWWASTVAARDGSATYSPFVTLDDRA